jgi:hypothetical protein
MARKNTVDDDEVASSAGLDALMDTDWENMPEVLDTIPTGTWRLRAKNGAYKDATENQSAKFLIFYIPAAPLDDVDPEALAAVGADYDFTNNQIVFTRYVENLRDVKGVMNLIALHGVDLDGLTPKQAIKKVAGKEVIASVGTRSYEGRFGHVTENTVANFAAVGEDE